ncbi:MAG: hypothetical protein ACTSPV_15210 [Candidatus Hodarchaeales archaeon]
MEESHHSYPFSFDDPTVIVRLYTAIESEELPTSMVRLLFKFRRPILDQPLQYIRNLKGGIISFFGLLSKEGPFNSPFDQHRKMGLPLCWNIVKNARNWEDLESLENTFLFLSHQTYREISSLRFWLRDVLIKRWAQECIDRFECRDPNILTKFDL